jgi:hypothetical protein
VDRCPQANNLLAREWEVGVAIAKSLPFLGLLKNLFFHASWIQGDEDADPRCLEGEAALEKLAMGDRYSETSAKYDRRHAWNGFVCGIRGCKICAPSVVV